MKHDEKTFNATPDIYARTDRIDLWIGKTPRSQINWNVVSAGLLVVGVGALIAAALVIAGPKINEWYNGNGKEMQHFEATNLAKWAGVANRFMK